MIYINDTQVREVPLDWHANAGVIERAVECLASRAYAQPIKPYLRYGDAKNRIIAMPGFVGGEINTSGIKWIASFPDNVKNGMPRAHCVVILNDADTGRPVGIINSGTISAIRTASVSGFVLKKYLASRPLRDVKVGIAGFGPIGQYHLRMCSEILAGYQPQIRLFDVGGIDVTKINDYIRDGVQVVSTWQEAYDEADIFITCTVAKERYIDRKPKPGSLHLNVSLRDYKTDVFPWFRDAIIVDEWEEVCRENTDVERFHLEKGLASTDAMTIQDLLRPDWLDPVAPGQPVLFNPMGMAVFDLAISKHYLERMKKEKADVTLLTD